MSKRNIICGIDIGTSTIRIVVLEYKKNDEFPSIIATTKVENSGMKMGYIINMGSVIFAIKKAISQIEKNIDTKIKKAVISINSISITSEVVNSTTIVTRADKEVTHLDIKKAMIEAEDALTLTNKKILFVSPIAYKLDGKEITGRPEGMIGTKVEVKTLFITCLKQHINDLVTAVTEAGVEVLDVHVGVLGASNILLSEKQKIVGCVLIDIGSEVTSAAVFEENTLINIMSLKIGGMDITKDIALGLKISLEEAESIKTGSITGDHDKKEIDEIIEARLVDIFELVNNQLKKLKRSGLLPSGAIITGGGAHIKNIEEIAKKELNLPIVIGPVDRSIIMKLKVRDETWYTALGLVYNLNNSNTEIENEKYFDDKNSFKNFFKSIFNQLMP